MGIALWSPHTTMTAIKGTNKKAKMTISVIGALMTMIMLTNRSLSLINSQLEVPNLRAVSRTLSSKMQISVKNKQHL